MAEALSRGRGSQERYAAGAGRRRRAGIVGYLPTGRPIVQNPDGTVSTHRNIVVGIDGRSVVLPTLYGGRTVSEEQAIRLYRMSGGIDPDTGQPFPTFDSDEAALAYERDQHQQLTDAIRRWREQRK